MKYSTVYHVSPEAGIDLFKGRYSPKFGQKGLFVSPSRKSITRDWAGYVAGKKFPRGESPRGTSFPQNAYRNLTVYTLEIPDDVLKRADEAHREKARQAYEKYGERAYGAWGWGPEIFVPEEYLDQLRIVGRETLTSPEAIRSRSYMPGGGRKIIDDPSNPAARLARRVEKIAAEAKLKGDNTSRYINILKNLRPLISRVSSDGWRYENVSPKDWTVEQRSLYRKLSKEFSTNENILREFVGDFLSEANVERLVSIANRDDRGILSTSQKMIVVGRAPDGSLRTDAYAGLHRVEIGWQVSFLWGRDPKATISVLLGALEKFGKLSVDTDMSPAAKAIVQNYYDSYKDDESRVLNYYLSRGRENPMYDAVFLGGTGFDLRSKEKQAQQMVRGYAQNIRKHHEEVEDDLFDQASRGFRAAYDDDVKTGRSKLSRHDESLLRGFVRSALREYSEEDPLSYVGVKGRAVDLKAGTKKADALEPEIFDMISKSYEPIGGHARISSRSHVTDEYPEWVVADVDDDPEPDVAVVGKEADAGGVKVGASGTDGGAKSKVFMNALKSRLLRNGWWGEVSGAPAYIAVKRLGLHPITDQAAVERVLGKKVKWVGDNPDPKFKGVSGWYVRDIGGQEHMKIIVGDVP